VIRAYLCVRAYGSDARHAMIRALAEAARTKSDLVDLINVAIEELVRQRFELPAFDTLERAARKVRASLARQLHRRVSAALSPEACLQIDALFIADLATRRTPWNELKEEPGRPTRTHLKELIARERWLSARNVGAAVLAAVPAVRVEHLAAEARSLDAARMMALQPHKRYTLAAALLWVQTARARDDLGTMVVRLMRRIHHEGKKALSAYREEAAPRTDALVGTLRDLVVAYAGRSGRWLSTVRVERTSTGERRVPLLDLSWIADGWWRLVTGERTRGQYPERVDRRQFEVCVFSQLLWDLTSGDLCIVGSAEFAAYNRQLIPWAEYERKVAAYGQMLGLPVQGPTFVDHVRGQLEEIARATDHTRPQFA
jgi:hypothetical protein